MFFWHSLFFSLFIFHFFSSTHFVLFANFGFVYLRKISYDVLLSFLVYLFPLFFAVVHSLFLQVYGKHKTIKACWCLEYQRRNHVNKKSYRYLSCNKSFLSTRAGVTTGKKTLLGPRQPRIMGAISFPVFFVCFAFVRTRTVTSPGLSYNARIRTKIMKS